MPGAGVLVEHIDGRVLFVRRADDGRWCHPGGHAEPGMSFVDVAVQELAEEAGIVVAPTDLVPFGAVSEPEAQTITYANGDVTQCYSMVYALVGWNGSDDDLAIDDESTDIAWFRPSEPPSPISPAAALTMQLWAEFRRTGNFQAR